MSGDSPRPSTSSRGEPDRTHPPTTTTARMAASTSQTPAVVSSHTTPEAAIAAANGDLRVALDNALNERNMLSNQNAQLWKLIEKQRDGYANVMRELERVRTERDRALGKRTALSNHSSTALNHSDSPQRPRRNLVRHASDEPVSPRQSAVEPAGPSSRQTDHLRPSSSKTILGPSAQVPAPLEARPPSPLAVPQRTESEPKPSSSRTPSPSPTKPLQINKDRDRTSSPQSGPEINGAASASDTTTAPALPVQTPRPSPNSNSTPVSASSTTNTKSVPPSPQPPPLPPPVILEPPVALSPPPANKRSVSRDSRISLPPEARQYIANMQDSPVASPEALYPRNASPEKPTRPVPSHPPASHFREVAKAANAEASLPPSLSITTPPSLPSSTSHVSPLSSVHPSPIFPTSSSSTTTPNQGPVVLLPTQPPTSAPLPTPSRVSHSAPASAASSSGHLPSGSVQQPPQPSASTGTLREPDSPPHSPPTIYTPDDVSPFSDLDDTASLATQSELTHAETIETDNQTLFTPSNSSDIEREYQEPRTRPPPVPQTPQHGESSTTSRAPRLHASDLATTRVHVTGSNIRANERGKEVLSFVIEVRIKGREPWRVEKLYNHVTALDARVRSVLDRHQLKKIANLPDNKLFKDHAPAKVDQRKATLEHYLQSMISAPVKDKKEICSFFSTDIIRETMVPVVQSGYKEGYLTKRGKNFGGWKTRYFVLQGPVLEYYESRGGTHLGSINITNAQIGRQQKTLEDESEYRHAFLIIEAKRGPGGQHTRHVLCAESDQERDAWVEVLVRYVMGSYDDSVMSMTMSNASLPAFSSSQTPYLTESISNTKDNHYYPTSSQPLTPRKGSRSMNKDDIAKGSAIPISHLPADPQNAKLLQSAPIPGDLTASSSPGLSPLDKLPTDLNAARRIMERGHHGTHGSGGSGDVGLSNSLPSSSPLDANPSSGHNLVSQRSNSELGHYPDLKEARTPAGALLGSTPTRPERSAHRQSYMPTLTPNHKQPLERPTTPDPPQSTHAHHIHSHSHPNTSRADLTNTNRVKISGPINGTPIPSGFKFGAKDTAEANGQAHDHQNNDRDRDRKGKSSGTFWRWKSDKPGASSTSSIAPVGVAHAVFGVPLQDSLAVAEIAKLPAIVFRCIEYLEKNKAEQEEGIYRLSGSAADIKALKDRFNAEGDVELLKVEEMRDPHAIAGLLKQYLRDLPSSILTPALHMECVGVMTQYEDPRDRVETLARLISQLPLANYSLLRALTAHLILIVQNAATNKMSIRNVGIVFSPTLGFPAPLFSLMLSEFNKVFNVDGTDGESEDEDDAASEQPTEQPHDSPVSKRLSVHSRRNSRNYQEGAADQLLGLQGRSLDGVTVPEDIQSDGEDDGSARGDESEAETDGVETDFPRTIDSHSVSNDDASSSSPATPHMSLVPPSLRTGNSNGSSTEFSPEKDTVQLVTSDEGSLITTPRLGGRAAGLAATRGLHVTTASEKRQSRQMMGMQGLPHSPRPHNLMGHTPSSATITNPHPHPHPIPHSAPQTPI
ncbi:hypothetical protein SISNIDRAFT_453295 [Sistotremastrum niveocremeum HHB9708]|uniref:RhoGAP-domain-containing protein n=1 Tax=Sistotremastrum niveocremeum HHB9708 TaxID=1314777 RepID=A0A164VR93_9AGAM|nr:hypothetical protein SISNIDRAFT_453295 [Sistotremastrum niveocremeum HHB9708]